MHNTTPSPFKKETNAKRRGHSRRKS
jgi:hypothetical protein